jgi:sugar lactone lactonase YvrE
VTAAGVVTNFAGATAIGNADGDVANARFNFPEGIAVDAFGTVYVSDTTNDTIRKISAGVVTTIAGFIGSLGSADGPESVARFGVPFGVTVGANRTVYVADRNNHTIRKIDAEGTVTTYAGLAGVSGATDGPAASARFSAPRAVAVDSDGTVYVAEIQQTIRAITPGGIVSTVAGLANTSGSVDGTGSAARFFQPSGIAVDSAHNLYVADAGNHTIRKIAPGGVVTTFAGLAGTSGSADGAGSAARFNFPRAVAVDSAGNVFVADTNNTIIRKITPAGVVTTVAGQAGIPGSTDGTGS